MILFGFINDSSEVNNSIDEIFSGDTNYIVNELSYPSLINSNWLVIYNFVEGICDTLSVSGDVYYDVSLHGETPTRIYASQFKTPNGALKTFISMFLVFGTVFLLYIQFKDFIDLLNSGSFIEAVKQIDSDENNLYRM